jgi:hypothetical protein
MPTPFASATVHSVRHEWARAGTGTCLLPRFQLAHYWGRA